MNPVFFTDRDLGRKFPAILREAGILVEEHRHHFQPDTSDEKWLKEVASHRWLAITHDRRIRYRWNERDAVMQAGVGLFIVIGNAPFAELAVNFVRTIPRIKAFLELHRVPFFAKVYRPAPSDLLRNSESPGRVVLWLSRSDWINGLTPGV